MNVWNFTGNLGKSAEIKYLPSGEAICTFSVAVTSGYGDKKKTTWANCALFGKQASGSLPQYLTTGTTVAISGEVTLEEWETNGVKNKALKVNVIKIDLIGSSERKQNQAPEQSAPTANQPSTDSFYDDIPFN